jgi:hypothetical protein
MAAEDKPAPSPIPKNLVKGGDKHPKISITRHARDRYKERCPVEQHGKDIDRAIRNTFKPASLIEYITHHRIIRLLNNGCADTEYYYNSGLIFVINPQTHTLITIEEQAGRTLGKDFAYVDADAGKESE